MDPAPQPLAKKRARRAQADDDGDGDAFARTRSGALPPAAAAALFGGGGDAKVAADLREREEAAPLYRGVDTTQEWAESDYWRVRAADAGPELIPPARLWLDLAAHDPSAGPFLSPYLGECTATLAAALAALAVLGLPQVAGAHLALQDDARLALTLATPALAARARIVPVAAPEPPLDPSPLLVGQTLLRADDRYEWDGAEQRDKPVDGELLVGVVYQCQVVVTNPTGRDQDLALLLQIPRGAVPVAAGFYTRTHHWRLPAYGTRALDYAFYFPAPGDYGHFPAHVTRRGDLLAHAAPRRLRVVAEPTLVDDHAWPHVSQRATTDQLLDYLDRHNLDRLDLTAIAWRMRDPDAFRRVLAHLEARGRYCDRLWAYALLHADRPRAAAWLRHQDHLLRPAGPVLEGALLDLDPVERGWYEHLEYAPLINARAHLLGPRRQIVNDALARHYREFLEVLAHRRALSADDRLAAAHYLFALDRPDDALAQLDRVDPQRLATRLQYDYLAAYAACARGDLLAARRLAAPWADHPVDPWRQRVLALLTALDEAEGRAPFAPPDTDARDRRIDDLAAGQPALDLSADGDALLLDHRALDACELRFYRMDIELLFSRAPFVQGDTARFAWIDPTDRLHLAFTADGRDRLPLPEPLRGQNLVIEARASGLRRAITRYAHRLVVELIDRYGQLRLLHADTRAPLPAAYVKVYARHRGGAVQFYKDGYTDLRGRFDYATLSTDDLDRVERLAILVVHDHAGATVLEAPPPPR